MKKERNRKHNYIKNILYLIYIMSYEIIKEILKSEDFLQEYKKYNLINKKENIINFLDNIETNKKYYRMNINKNKKYKKEVTEDTTTIKEINGLVNRITDMNYDKIKPLIIEKIKSEHLIPYLIENICDNAILHHKYISLYVGVLKEINSKNKVKMIMKICNNYHSKFFDKKENDINNMTYHELCLKNKNIDNIIGLSLFITYLEKEQIINGLIDNILEPYMNNILINEDDNEIYKMILSFYNISQIYYENKPIPDIYIYKLKTLKNKTKSSKIKYKIMDILGE